MAKIEAGFGAEDFSPGLDTDIMMTADAVRLRLSEAGAREAKRVVECYQGLASKTDQPKPEKIKVDNGMVLPPVTLYDDGSKRTWQYKNKVLSKIVHGDGQVWSRVNNHQWKISLPGKRAKTIEMKDVKINADKSLTWEINGIKKSISANGNYYDPSNKEAIKKAINTNPDKSKSECSIPEELVAKSKEKIKSDVDAAEKRAEIKGVSQKFIDQVSKLKPEDMFLSFIGQAIVKSEVNRGRRTGDEITAKELGTIIRDAGKHNRKYDVGIICFNALGDAPMLFKTMHDLHPERFNEIFGRYSDQLLNTNKKAKHNAMNAHVLEDKDLRSRMRKALVEFDDAQFVAVGKVARDGWRIAAEQGCQKLLQDDDFRGAVADMRVHYGPTKLEKRLKHLNVASKSVPEAIKALCITSDDRQRMQRMKAAIDEYQQLKASL